MALVLTSMPSPIDDGISSRDRDRINTEFHVFNGCCLVNSAYVSGIGARPDLLLSLQSRRPVPAERSSADGLFLPNREPIGFKLAMGWGWGRAAAAGGGRCDVPMSCRL